MPTFDWWIALPTLVPAAYGLLLLLFVPALRNDRRWLWYFSLAGMTVSAIVPAIMLQRIGSFGGFAETAGVVGRAMVRTDRFGLWLDVLFAVAGLLALLILPRYLERARAYRPEVFPLLFISVAGMTAMVGTENLLMVFIGLEVLSIPLYVMTGMNRDNSASIEAGFKYFILGAFSTGFLVYGIALVFGATGSMQFAEIAAAVGNAPALAPFGKTMLLGGVALILVGFFFKIAAVPFHFWAPDVYTGAPTPITAFMAAATKAAAFGVLLRLLHSAFDSAPDLQQRWTMVVSVIAVITMIGGNLIALAQTRVKRLLAYSSIAHAGYLLLALIAPLEIGTANLLFYLLAYSFMTIGAFAVVTLFQEEGEDADHLSNFAGLRRRRPGLALVMGLFMLSLTGIPPTGGFTGKYVIFLSALQSGHPWLAAVMAISAVIGAGYYMRVVVAMFLLEPEGSVSSGITVPAPVWLALGIAAAATIVLGVYPSVLLDALSDVASGMLAALP